MKNQKSLFRLLSLMILSIPISMHVPAQNEYYTLTFNGDNNGLFVDLDSIYIRNLTSGVDTMLYDTIYTITNLESHKCEKKVNFSISPASPNPVFDQTRFTIQLPSNEMLRLSVYNILGQNILNENFNLKSGSHSFCFQLGHEAIYIITAYLLGNSRSIKILNNSAGNQAICNLTYEGFANDMALAKSEIIVDMLILPGDELLFVGYSQFGESGFTDAPDGDRDYVFQFATNIPCPGTDSLYYEGQWYHTIQVFNQCWFKENLNVGEWINSSQPQTNNNIIEKYCMANMSLGCELFGGLYFKFEMMNYIYESGGQGICPEGWHVPLDMDWKILEGSVDSVFGIGNPVWNSNGWRGSYAGGNLKQTGTNLWEPPNVGATDAFGFNLVPAGYFVQNEFWGPGYKTYLWTSDYPTTYYRNMDWDKMDIRREPTGTSAAISVRCIKNQHFTDK